MLPRSVSDHPVSLDTVITSPFPSYTMSHDLARLQRRCVLGLIYPSFLLMPQWLLLLNHLLTPHIYFPSISFHHSVISITTQRAISGYCVWQYAGRHGQSLWCMAGTLVHNCRWGGGLSRCHKLTFLSCISHTAVLIMNIRIHANITELMFNINHTLMHSMNVLNNDLQVVWVPLITNCGRCKSGWQRGTALEERHCASNPSHSFPRSVYSDSAQYFIT